MTTQNLTIGIRALTKLVDPVIPFAERDGMLPVLNSVRIESHGTHLLAITTDRFRLGCQRLAAPAGSTWPAFEATIPLAAVKSIKALFKPSGRGLDTDLTLTVEDDTLEVEAAGALLDLLGAKTRYRLAVGEWPKTLNMLAAVIDRESTVANFAVSAGFLADYARVGSGAPLCVKTGQNERDSIMFTDGEDFIGILMPRRLPNEVFPSLDDWRPILAPASEKKAPAKKRATKKAVA